MWRTIKRELKYFLAEALRQLFYKTVLFRFVKNTIREFRGWTERQMERGLMEHELRLWVYRTYGKRCLYPGCSETEQIEIDHVRSLWEGGKTEKSNLQPLCRKHNRMKNTKTMDFRK